MLGYGPQFDWLNPALKAIYGCQEHLIQKLWVNEFIFHRVIGPFQVSWRSSEEKTESLPPLSLAPLSIPMLLYGFGFVSLENPWLPLIVYYVANLYTMISQE